MKNLSTRLFKLEKTVINSDIPSMYVIIDTAKPIELQIEKINRESKLNLHPQKVLRWRILPINYDKLDTKRVFVSPSWTIEDEISCMDEPDSKKEGENFCINLVT